MRFGRRRSRIVLGILLVDLHYDAKRTEWRTGGGKQTCAVDGQENRGPVLHCVENVSCACVRIDMIGDVPRLVSTPARDPIAKGTTGTMTA